MISAHFQMTIMIMTMNLMKKMVKMKTTVSIKIFVIQLKIRPSLVVMTTTESFKVQKKMLNILPTPFQRGASLVTPEVAANRLPINKGTLTGIWDLFTALKTEDQKYGIVFQGKFHLSLIINIGFYSNCFIIRKLLQIYNPKICQF